MSWEDFFKQEEKKEYYSALKQKVDKSRIESKVYPPAELTLKAFESADFNDIKVVILGQDPYHGVGQAEGLSFSVQKGVKKPPSLKNIFKELKSDLGIEEPESGSLLSWAENGVFLLNSILTVEEKSPGSHSKYGWSEFTDNAIKFISDNKNNVVFILWGAYAQQKEDIIDNSKHCVVKSSHPSPFSARKSFFGSKPFSKSNEYLKSHGIKEVNWDLNLKEKDVE